MDAISGKEVADKDTKVSLTDTIGDDNPSGEPQPQVATENVTETIIENFAEVGADPSCLSMKLTPSTDIPVDSSNAECGTSDGSECRLQPIVLNSKPEPTEMLELIRESYSSLHILWETIGVSEEACQTETANIQSSINSIFQAKLATFQKSLNELNAHLTSLTRQKDELLAILSEADECSLESPLSVKQRIETTKTRIEELKEIHHQRSESLRSLQSRIAEIAELTGEDATDVLVKASGEDMTDLSSARLDSLAERLESLDSILLRCNFVILKQSKNTRKQDVGALLNSCQGLLRQMNIEATSNVDVAIFSEGKGLPQLYSIRTLELLRGRQEELNREKIGREEKLKELGETIDALWKELEVDPTSQRVFFSKMNGLTREAMDACDAEIRRLHQIKQNRLAALVEEVREKLRDLWEKLEFSDEARRKFEPAFVEKDIQVIAFESLSEESLGVHEEEYQRLDRIYVAMQPLLKYVERRENIIKERAEYEESMKDPERLLSIGRDTGRLLREEKLQNRIKKELPKVTSKLETCIPEWEKEHGMTFTYKGGPYLDVMREEDAAYLKQKEEERLAKKNRKLQALQRERGQGPLGAKGYAGGEGPQVSVRRVDNGMRDLFESSSFDRF